MDEFQTQPDYRLSVRAEARARRWRVLQEDALAMHGEAATVDLAFRVGDLAAGLHTAFRRIERR